MVITTCKKCRKKFSTKASQLKYRNARFCSRLCQYAARRVGHMVKCDMCGKESYKQLARIKKSKSKKLFCGKSCQTKWRNTQFVGSRHANWVDGKSTYRDVLLRSKVVEQCRLCKTDDKRLLAGHHIDKDRTNNTLRNLDWLCHNCHFLIHHYKNERMRFVDERRKIC